MRWIHLQPGKSGAREVAVALLIFWVFLVCYLFFWIPKDDVASYREMFGTVTMAIFAVVTGAFGVAAVMNRMPGSAPQPPRSIGGASPPNRPSREID